MLTLIKGRTKKIRGVQETLKGACVLIAAALLWIPAEVFAFGYDVGENTHVDLDTHLQWSGAWRMKDQAPANLADINGDDGNRNFDKHDWVNNLWNITADVSVKYKDVGVFVRPRAYYDFAYDGTNANDSLATNNNGPLFGGPLTATNQFMEETKDLHRDKVEILDAYGFGVFKIGDHFLDVRAGRQVINWGESFFSMTGIGSSQNAVDATKANIPGTELRDLYLPTGQVYSSMSLPGNLSMGGFYAWEFEPSRLDESGSYFSSADYYMKAGRRLIIDSWGLTGLVGTAPTVDRRLYEEAGSGQYGANLLYVADWLMDTEFGFYFMNYHDKFPTMKDNKGYGGTRRVTDWTAIVGSASGPVLNYIDDSSYDLFFKEDIKLFGMSVGTTVGDTNLGMEMSYRKDLAILVEDALSPIGVTPYLDAEVFSALMNVVYNFGPSKLWDQLSLVGEVGMDRVYNVDDVTMTADAFAWGGTAKLTFDFLSPIPRYRVKIKVPVSYNYRPNGTSPVTGSYAEGADSINITTQFDFYERVKVGVGYTDYLHSATEYSRADRDLLSVYVKYSF